MVAAAMGVPLYAQTFEPIPPLFFVKPFAGADPLPQMLNVANVGNTFTFSATASTNNGGNWLSTSPAGFCCNAPQTVAAIVTTTAAMAAGTYTGNIAFTSGTVTLNVPVTLVIAAATGTFFDNVPGALNFSMMPGGSMPSQAMQIRSAGAGGAALNWSLSATTYNAGNWLTVSSTSGTAPAFITVGIQAQSLPGGGLTAGTFDGQLLFQSAGSSVTVPISVTVGTTVIEQVNPLYFTKPYTGLSPLPQTVTIASSGTTFAYSATAYSATGGSWLTVSPSGFCCNTPEPLTITANPAVTLAAGTYTGEIWVTSGHLSTVIPVTMTVAALTGTYFDNVAGGLSYSLPTASATTPPSQLLQIRNAGTGTLNWTVTTTTGDNGNWLTVSPTSGAAPSQITVAIVPGNLPNQGLTAGVFVGNLLFQEANSTVTVPITVTVGNGFKQVNGLSFTMLQAGPDPLPQNLAIASNGPVLTFSADADTATGGNWLTVSPSGLCCNTPSVLTVTVTAPVTMPAGTYTGEVFVYTNSQRMTVPVTLTIVAAGGTYLDNLPGGLSFSMATGGQPSPQQFQIRGVGPNSLNWNLTASTSDGGNWLMVSSTSGTAPSQITVSIVPANLPGLGLEAGIFNGQLLVQTAGGASTIPISLAVGGNVFAQINGINFTMPQAGANPLPQTLEATSIGSTLTYTVSYSTATGGNWLTVSPTGFCCNTPNPVTVTVNAPPTLPAGTYTGQVVFSNGSNVMTIPVTLTVAAPSGPFFDNVPGQLAYSLVTGAGNPPSQSVLIQNRGTGTLNWTATPATADGANWLTVSSTSGAAPSQVTIGVVTSMLPNQGLVAGVFTGQVLFLSAGSSVSIPVSVAVGGNRFAQTNGIAFTMPLGGANPLPQTLTMASLGSTITYTVSFSTGNGGNWLTASPTGLCCNTPEVLTATVNAPVGLAAGTYIGQIVASGGGAAATIPVTLNVVAAATGPLFDNVQGQMSFSAATSATPANQTLQIRNYGGGQLNWTVTTVTADGGNWLTVSAPNGTAPSNVTVGIAAGNLPSQGLVAGEFTGELWFQSGIPGSSVTVPVSVNIGPNVFAQPAPLTFTTAFGTNPSTQTLAGNSTGTTITYSVTASSGNGGAWLSTTPTGLCCNSPENITVKVTNPTTLVPPGTYTGQVVFTRTASAMTVPVTLTVTGAFTFTLSATSANATAAGGPGSVNVTASSQSAPWTAVSNVSWITITSGASGTGNGTVNYSVAPTTLTTSQIGMLTIAGQTFTVTQAGASFTLSPPSITVPSIIGNGAVTVTSTSPAAGWTAVSNSSFLAITSGGVGTGNGTVNYSVAANTGAQRVGTLTIAGQTFTVTQAGTGTAGMGFYPLTPCRVVDTRNGQGKTGQFGPPNMGANTTRNFQIPAANCGVPATAQAYSLNVTVIPATTLTYLSIWPTGQPQPVVSTLNSLNGAIVANAAIVPSGTNGSISVFVSNQTDVIIDVNGYFAPVTSTALAFYPATPCRVVDTRAGQGKSGAFGPPTLGTGSSRDFPIPNSSCGIPANAQAYALNMTVVPTNTLGYLSVWPTGLTQPVVSTLNSLDGRIIANAAIVPAGNNGSITVFVSDASDVIIDINGYFAPPGSPGALYFYTATPCRIVDTRAGQGQTGQFGPPSLVANQSRNFPVLSSSCGLPSTAQAYSLNMTVVPPGQLIYLTTWPTGVTQPVVSTLNALNGQITANAAIVPAGTGGQISVFVSNNTDLIVDVNGYFGQ